MAGLTLDTGALIALEARKLRARSLIEATRRDGGPITVPASVVVEWWRGQTGKAAALLRAFYVEPLTPELAKVAGMALKRCASGPSATDAVVMASAALRGDTVLTSDVDDLGLLEHAVFHGIRILRV